MAPKLVTSGQAGPPVTKHQQEQEKMAQSKEDKISHKKQKTLQELAHLSGDNSHGYTKAAQQ